MEEKINGCQTLAELCELERTHLLNEEEQRLVFERRLQIFQRIHEWREENKKLGIDKDFLTSGATIRILSKRAVARNVLLLPFFLHALNNHNLQRLEPFGSACKQKTKHGVHLLLHVFCHVTPETEDRK